MSRRRTQMGCSCSRREFLARGLYGIGVGAGLPLALSRTSAALTAQALQGTSAERHPERILVVIELGGGNDGLNTVVPFSFDPYYKLRPVLVEVAQGGRIENWLTGFSGGRFPKLSLVQSRFTEARLHFTGSSSSSASRCRRTAPSPSRSTYWQRP